MEKQSFDIEMLNKAQRFVELGLDEEEYNQIIEEIKSEPCLNDKQKNILVDFFTALKEA